jgi:hypothetical protein
MTSKTKAQETKTMREGRAQLRANWGAKKTARVLGKIQALMTEIEQREDLERRLWSLPSWREGRSTDDLRAEIRQIGLKACGLTLEQARELYAKRVAN